MSLRRRWLRRVVTAVVLAVVAVATASVAGYDPEPVRVTLLAVLGVAGVGLLVDVLPRARTSWYAEPTHRPVHEGRDHQTRMHVRLLEDHQRSRHPDAALRDRLAVLADQVLVERHGLRADSESGRSLLGPDTVAVLQGPVVRLNPRRIDQVLRTIEEL